MSDRRAYYVEIVRESTGEVLRRMGPMDLRRAERVEDGDSINLHQDCYTRIVEVGP